jgi:hypothetical protein
LNTWSCIFEASWEGRKALKERKIGKRDKSKEGGG